MVENQEQHAKPKEMEIPVFTVLKNNCILKNIFLLNNPAEVSVSENVNRESEVEEILVVGRHPDCSVKLEHPSISRFHLHIHSKPSSRSLYVTDLSSVHGTWISGNRVEPGARMKLNEGDTLRLGASSRLYRLHWVPISRAYDKGDPFVPPQLNEADAVEEEPCKATDQDQNTFLIRNDQDETMEDNLEGLEWLFSDEDFCSAAQKTSPMPPPVSEDLNNSVTIEEIEKYSSPGLHSREKDIFHSQPGELEQEHRSPCDLLESFENSRMNSKKRSCQNIWSRRSKPESIWIETSRLKGKSSRINTSSQVEKSFIDEKQTSESIPMYLDNEEEKYTPDKENVYPDSLLLKTSNRKKEERMKNELVLSTPASSVEADEEIFTPDKENMTPDSRLLRSMNNVAGKNPSSSHRSSPLRKMYNSNMYQEKAVSRSLQASQHMNAFGEWKSTNATSKMNGSSKKQLALSKSRANREPFCPLPTKSISGHKSNSKPSTCEDDTMRGSRPIKYAQPDENSTAKVAQDKWIIVVDTACLLEKKSRKQLNLLCGLRGTNLFIPRIVVRELDCLLRRGSFFSRTKDVYAALQFIEESMAVAKWWIHVQSSAEEVGLLPPTPPALSPKWFSENTWANSIGSTPFSPCGLQEIVTPTPGDHILDYALCCRRIRKGGQVVLLSDDVALKIKAMAEGILCETAEEFRRSLVNPFSDKCLFTNCSPIGPTWICEDDVVLKEKYYPSPSKKGTRSSEGSVKGLKLILMHNSRFRQIRPAT